MKEQFIKALPVACVIATLCLSGCSQASAGPKTADGSDIKLIRVSEWKDLNDRLAALEKDKETLEDAFLEVGKAVTSRADIDLDNAYDTFSPIGPFWQATNLTLAQHLQGCLVKGKLMNRLYVERTNVSVEVDLLDDEENALGQGKGILEHGLPGRYAPFSVLVRTDKKLAKVSKLRVHIFTDSGGTSEM